MVEYSTTVERVDEADWNESPIEWERPDDTVLVYGVERRLLRTAGVEKQSEIWRLNIRRKFKNGNLTVFRRELVIDSGSGLDRTERLPEMVKSRIGMALVRWDENRIEAYP